MDDDSDGIVKIEHVNKVIELLGRDNVNLSTKQVKNIIDLLGKEEMLEVERRIEKILGKIPSTEALEAKLAEAKKKEDLVDSAEELSEEAGSTPEHVQHLFVRPAKQTSENSNTSTASSQEKSASDQPKTSQPTEQPQQQIISKISALQLEGLSAATVRNAADLALLTREQELVALSAKKILAAANESQPKEKLLARAEDVLQKRIQEDSVADTARVEETTAAAEDNSVKEVDEVHKDDTDLIQSEEKAEKVPRKNGTNH